MKKYGNRNGKSNGNRKRILAACLAALVMTMLGGCGSAGYDSISQTSNAVASDWAYNGGSADYDSGFTMMASESAAMDVNMPMQGASMAGGSSVNGEFPMEDGGNSMAADTGRKLIKTVDMRVETKEFDTMTASLSDRVKELGGYIEHMNTYNGSSYSSNRGTRTSSMTIRIPQKNLDSFLETVSGIGNVVSRSDNVEDVTLAYVDMESHKEMLKVEQERLLTLLERAESIEDIITIESRLSNVRYQIESMESQLRTFDNQVDYSTVYLDISEVKELTPVVEKNGWQRMTEGFMNSLKKVGNGIVEFVIWFVVHIPYLVIWALVIAGIVLFIRLLIKRSRKKKERKRQEREAGQVSANTSNTSTDPVK